MQSRDFIKRLMTEKRRQIFKQATAQLEKLRDQAPA